MGRLENGQWVNRPASTDSSGRFVRKPTVFRNWISNDGSTDFPAEANRYHLYVSWACPWAHRAIIVRKLLRLEDVISVAIADHFMGDDGWRFIDAEDTVVDTVNGIDYLREIYLLGDAKYTGRVTVPVLWDKESRRIVSNESREIIRMFGTAFRAFGDPTVDLCPEPLRQKIGEVVDALYNPINNGVYRAGFARTQEAYEEAVAEVFAGLDRWEGVLSRQAFLAGDVFTEADVCLFTTLFRFEHVYHFHFKCNRKRLRDYPNLWNYAKQIYQWPGVSATCNVKHIKHHYFRSHESINPRRVVPVGPDVDFDEPHDRDRFATSS